MNSFLAQLYGTSENLNTLSGADSSVEKLAEAQVMEEVLANQGVDINKLDGETLLKVASELFGTDSALAKVAEGEETEEEKKEEKKEEVAEEKKEGETETEEEKEEEEEEDAEKKAADELAQADYLGRVAAHAFMDEQAKLVKQAQFEQAVAAKGEIALQKIAALQTQTDEQELAGIIEKLAEERAIEMLKQAGGAREIAKAGLEHIMAAGAKAKDVGAKAADWAKKPVADYKLGKATGSSTLQALKDSAKMNKAQALTAGGLAAAGAGAGVAKAVGGKKDK